MKNNRAFCSWSGGKDSCLALRRVLGEGLTVTHLLTMFDETGERSRSHAVSLEVMQAQADALGLELVAPCASWADYETVFVEQLRQLKARNIETAVFGDIDLQPHRDWEEKVCAAAGIAARLPLWNEKRLDMVNEFLDAGFRAVVICVDEKFLSKEFCGREFDRKFIADLPAGIDACGENGEFHTFVYDGALFKNPVNVKVADVYQHKISFPTGEASYYYANLTI